MKRTSLILVAVFALAVLPFAFAQSAPSPTQDPTAQPTATPSQQTPSQTNPSTSPSSDPSGNSAGSSTSDSRSFVGSIAKSGGKYVLHTAGTDYQLDDQTQAKKFNGKDVKVTGQLDASSNTIRVQSIDAASSM